MKNQVFTIKPSFFDEANLIDPKIWKKGIALKKPSEVRLIEGILFKRSTRTNFWKSRYYVLFEDRLAYYKVLKICNSNLKVIEWKRAKRAGSLFPTKYAR